MEGRTDVKYINTENNKKIVWEIKINKVGNEYFHSLKKEGLIRLEKYMNIGKYDNGYLILIDLIKVDCEIFER